MQSLKKKLIFVTGNVSSLKPSEEEIGGIHLDPR